MVDLVIKKTIERRNKQITIEERPTKVAYTSGELFVSFSTTTLFVLYNYVHWCTGKFVKRFGKRTKCLKVHFILITINGIYIVVAVL